MRNWDCCSKIITNGFTITSLFAAKNRQVSEELVQEVFYRIVRYRHTYRKKGNFVTCMYTIARNARIDYFREHSVQTDLLEETNDIISSDPNPHEQYEHESEIDLVRKAIAALPEDKREVIIMSRFNNMRYEEIGKVLGCIVGAVKVRVYRAIRELTKIYFRMAGETSHVV